jgi:putative PIN family toxin of toxin-antitoxin system
VRRVVCDVGVVISGLLSPGGPPAALLDLWRDGVFDIAVSLLWLEELDRVIARPKIARYIDASDAAELREAILRQAVLIEDPPNEPGLTSDPGDDYLVSLARVGHADLLVSGDHHLLDLHDPVPAVVSPRAFLDSLDARARR